MRVVIIGGGIGGLTTALSLHAAGVEDLVVLESTAEIKPLGVGINVLPHAVRELTELGLANELATLGVATSELAFYNMHGNRIWSEVRGTEAGYLWPQYSIHRGVLQMMLLDAVRDRLGESTVRCGMRVARVADWADGAHVLCADDAATEFEADVAVAADGIHSAVRAQWHPGEGAPEWYGSVLWRGTSQAPPFLTGRTMAIAGHRDLKFVAYPISEPDADGQQVINWIAERRAPDESFEPEDWNRKVAVDVFAEHFEDWSFSYLDIPTLIAAASDVYEYPMVDRAPLSEWTRGRVTLLGDAAHPTYPIGSIGTSQAIIDGRVLAHCLATLPIDVGLARYEQVRLPPTRGIQQAGRKMGPGRVMQLAHERAPEGFSSVDDVFAQGELQSIADEYKKLAGFDPKLLNERPSWSVG